LGTIDRTDDFYVSVLILNENLTITQASTQTQSQMAAFNCNPNNATGLNQETNYKLVYDEKELSKELTSLQNIDSLGTQLSSILGLDDLEAKIYLNLLRVGPISASALAKEIDIERTKMYRTIEKLINQNIVSSTFSKPKLCIATEPEEVSKNLPTFHIIQGSSNIYSDIGKLIENSTDIVYIVTTLKDISKMYHTNIPEKIKICEKNGGEVRLLTEMNDYGLMSYIERIDATETKLSKLASKGRIVVSKDIQMIMSDATMKDHENNYVSSDFAFSTNSYEMVNNIYTLCTLLWKSSKRPKMLASN